MIKFAHISPTSMATAAIAFSGINLVLAHLVGKDGDKLNTYTKLYAESSLETIMDNGAFELGESMDPELLMEKAKLVNATYIVLPDYPGQPRSKTIEAAKKWIPIYKKAGFKTFFVPQAEKGDINGLLACWDWAIQNPDIDLIGNSILGAPNAFGKMNGLLARYRVLRDIAVRYDSKCLSERIHMLGMLDTVHEIALVTPFHWMINSWDSSAAVWYGINGKDVTNEFIKFKLPVDFHCETMMEHGDDIARDNMTYINSLLNREIV